MKDLLDFVGEHNFLKMGDYRFSPLMELSTGIALEYCKKISEDNCKQHPLFICFPEKQSSSLWMAISILTNYYFEDYINNEVEGITFRRGEKVKIFNCIGEIERVSQDNIYLKFKDQGGIPINKLRSQLSKVGSHRSLSRKSKFSENFMKSKNKRTPISKILIPGDAESINQNNLESKVLLIAGRGNVKNKYRLLNEVEIYDTPLSKVYPENKNLIIKSDLKPFTDVFDKDERNRFLAFRDHIIRLSEVMEIEGAKIELENIAERLKCMSGINEELDEVILTFFYNYENELPDKIKFLENKYPGVQEQLPEKLRAVVINDIHQIYDFPNCIKGFLERKIPVIFISNRNIRNSSDLDLYKRLFDANPDYFRINWNKKKVHNLLSITDETNFIDRQLWLQCKRYSEQEININVVEGCELDLLIPQIFNDIKEMDEFELLQKSFYQNFYPALFSLKNSMTSNEFIDASIREFQISYNSVRSNIPLDKTRRLDKVISLALNFRENTKHFFLDNNIFSQIFPSKLNLYIPAESGEQNIPNSDTEKITFTGHPYLEYSGKYLLNATCVHFVKEINLLCWPNEASRTLSYLQRRIQAGYFTDNISDIVSFKKNHLLKGKTDFQEEINSYLNISRKLNVEDNEDIFGYIDTFKYKGYGVECNDAVSFTVKCDILNFKDGSFMFLPHRSKIMAQSEDDFGRLKISQRSLNDLSIGDNIFKYIKDKEALRSMAKSDQKVLSHFQKLEYWKDILENLYISCDNDINKLKSLLEKIKRDYSLNEGNPSISSIRNWLLDEEFLKPENGNLKIILLANNERNIEGRLQELDESYRQVLSYTISLSSQIKKQIKKQASSKLMQDEDLKLRINGSEIIVQTRRIVSIDRNDIEVDYRNTRKILC